jgi:carbonic anhydrase
MSKAKESLECLKQGNQRFVSGFRSLEIQAKQLQRAELVDGQTPFAIILGCSDSRVPAEIIFDQGLGSLFVIRVAGNIVAPSLIGSVEFAAIRFGTPLVIVLGHSMCGAVIATIDELNHPSVGTSENILSIVNRIKPNVQPLFETELQKDPKKLLEKAIRANIYASINQLRHGSQLLEQLIEKDQLTIIGAEYSLKTGIVEFFDSI